MSFKLEKPYTYDEREEFISYHHNMYGRPIVELDTLYALEPREIVVNGEIIIDKDYDIKQFNNLKLNRIRESEYNRNKKILSGVMYKDILFDSDTDQKINLLATINMMSDEDTIVWYGMDNQGLLCTKADLMAIGGLITELHSFCWNKNAYIKEQIEQAETIEEVNEIEISYDR